MSKVENNKAETKKVDEIVYVTIEKYFREYLENNECRVIKFMPCGQSYSANKKTKKPARISVALPPEICGADLRDLNKWSLTIVAVPIEIIHPKKKEERDEKDNGKKK